MNSISLCQLERPCWIRATLHSIEIEFEWMLANLASLHSKLGSNTENLNMMVYPLRIVNALHTAGRHRSKETIESSKLKNVPMAAIISWLKLWSCLFEIEVEVVVFTKTLPIFVEVVENYQLWKCYPNRYNFMTRYRPQKLYYTS